MGKRKNSKASPPKETDIRSRAHSEERTVCTCVTVKDDDSYSLFNDIGPRRRLDDVWEPCQQCHTDTTRGLLNQQDHNVCYMNAAVQLILSSPLFRNFLLCCGHPSNERPTWSSLRRLALEMNSSGEPLALQDVFEGGVMDKWFETHGAVRGAEEDAIEFANFLFQTMHDEFSWKLEVNDFAPVGQGGKKVKLQLADEEESLFRRFFGGKLRREHRTGTKLSSVHVEPFWIVHIPLLKSITLQDLLDSYVNEECDGPKFSTFTKLESPPSILVVAVIRSQFDHRYAEAKKIESLLTFRDTLQLGTLEYRVCGISYHRGGNSDSGHFVTCVKRGDKWYHVDDESVTDIQKNRLHQKSVGDPYVFLFERGH